MLVIGSLEYCPQRLCAQPHCLAGAWGRHGILVGCHHRAWEIGAVDGGRQGEHSTARHIPLIHWMSIYIHKSFTNRHL